MESPISTFIGNVSIVHVHGFISNYTMFVATERIAVAPYHDFTEMALMWHSVGHHVAITRCKFLGVDALEIRPLLNKTGWDFKDTIKDILKTC